MTHAMTPAASGRLCRHTSLLPESTDWPIVLMMVVALLACCLVELQALTAYPVENVLNARRVLTIAAYLGLWTFAVSTRPRAS